MNSTFTAVKRSGVVLSILFIGLLVSCDDSSPTPSGLLEDLPADTGGEHNAHPLGSDASPYGYYLYTPSSYSHDGPKFPLLIFLHGSGETGNSQTNATVLKKILVHGPPKLIEKGTWQPKYPMIVASLQCHEGWWDPGKVKSFTEFMMNNLQVDTTRIYLTGLSMGGFGTWDLLTMYGKKSHITAAVPICGGGSMTNTRVAQAALFPIWAFHGEDDKVVYPDFDKAMWKAINALNPVVPAKLTMYPATSHDSWTKTYDGTGMGTGDSAYDPFDTDIYTWMFQYQKQ